MAVFTAEKYPFFSIIIPTYRRPRQLATCLESLSRLAYPRDRYEVIVVDDGNEPSLEPVVAPFRDDLQMTFLAEAHAGPAAARNAGAARAKGDFLAFTDDDCAPAPDWLLRLGARFTDDPHCVIGGRVINALSDNLCSATSHVLLDFLYEYHLRNPSYDRFYAASNLACPAAPFSAMGGFDETFKRAGAEDRDLCFRWLHQGFPLIYEPEAIVYHSHFLDAPAFWGQHFRYGRGAFRYHQLRAKRLSSGLRLKGPPFYTDLLLYPHCTYSDGSNWHALLLTVLLAVSQGANAAGFLSEFVAHHVGKIRSLLRSVPDIRPS